MKLFYINSLWTFSRAAIGWPMLLIGLYFFTVLIGSNIPVNNDWEEPEHGITLFVETNGVHVSLIVPMQGYGEDLSDLIHPRDLRDPDKYGTHAMIGWGHGGVYRNAKNWSDLTIHDAWDATSGSNDTLLHIYHRISPQANSYRYAFRVRKEEYKLIIVQIRASFKLDANGKATKYTGYGSNNLFYEAYGHYSIFNTCNEWTSDILRNAGIKMGIWTPMAGGVMHWFRPKE